MDQSKIIEAFVKARIALDLETQNELYKKYQNIISNFLQDEQDQDLGLSYISARWHYETLKKGPLGEIGTCNGCGDNYLADAIPTCQACGCWCKECRYDMVLNNMDLCEDCASR